MKKLIIILIFIIFSKVCSEEKQNQDSLNFNRNAFFIEIIGNSVSLFCLNYEYTFLSKILTDDIGKSLLSIRLGAGSGFWVANGGFISTLNYQYGKTKRIEFGAGFMYPLGKLEDLWKTTTFEKTKYRLIMTFTLGYKFVDLKDDWLFRIGYTPRISMEGKVWHSIGISYGWIW